MAEERGRERRRGGAWRHPVRGKRVSVLVRPLIVRADHARKRWSSDATPERASTPQPREWRVRNHSPPQHLREFASLQKPVRRRVLRDLAKHPPGHVRRTGSMPRNVGAIADRHARRRRIAARQQVSNSRHNRPLAACEHVAGVRRVAQETKADFLHKHVRLPSNASGCTTHRADHSGQDCARPRFPRMRREMEIRSGSGVTRPNHPRPGRRRPSRSSPHPSTRSARRRRSRTECRRGPSGSSRSAAGRVLRRRRGREG